MKRLNFLLILTLLACTMGAQPAVFFSRTEADLGTLLWKEPGTATFSITNRGDKPLLISYVETDCGCTRAIWTDTPIEPEKSGEVSATFDAGQLGRFQKMVAVYTNADEAPYYLTLRGHVVSKPETHNDTHPYQIGNICLNRNTIDFADAYKGDRPTIEISIINTGDAPYTPVLMHLPPYISMKAVPATLPRKKSGILQLTLETDKLPHLGLTQTSVFLSRYMGDKVSTENEITVSATLLPDLLNLSADERAQAPKVELSATNIDFGPFGSKKQFSQTLTLSNKGKSPLQIQELQVSAPALSASLRKSVLAPGEDTKLKVTATAKYLKKEQVDACVMLITNDPTNPKVEINVPLRQ